MRRGCIIFTVVLAVLILLAGYFGYRFITSAIGIPEDLQPYEESAAALALIKSKAPPPADGSKLTERQVALYVQGLDSVDLGLRVVLAAVDSMGLSATSKLDSTVNFWKTPSLIRAAQLYGLLTRRAIVNFLNRNNLSLAEYEWIKTRVITASGITQEDVDSLLNVAMPPSSAAWGMMQGQETKNPRHRSHEPDAFFQRIDSLRSSPGGIDSTESTLVRRYRPAILDRGLASMIGCESFLNDDR